MTLPNDPALPESRPATIAEFVAVLGLPRNRAEELVIKSMRRLAVENTDRQVIHDATADISVRLLLRKEQYGLWRAALELYYAVLAYRGELEGDDA